MPAAANGRAHLSIGEVLSLLQEEFPDVTISKIRFLESQGLLDPERTPSGYRKFYDDDIERLRWILRLQKDHYLPLKVIKDRLDESGGVPPLGDNGTGSIPIPGGDDVTEEMVEPEPQARAARPDRAQPGGGRSAAAAPPVRGGGRTPASTAGGGSAGGQRGNRNRATGRAPGGRGGAAPRSGEAAARPAPAPGASGSLRARTVNGTAEAADASDGAGTPAGTGAGGSAGASSPRGSSGTGPERRSGSGGGGRRQTDRRASASGANASSRGTPAGGYGPASPGNAARPPSGDPASRLNGHAAAYDPGPEAVSLTADELAEASGLSLRDIRDLERFGLIETREGIGGGTYDGDALIVARTAAGFLQHGIEARHMRTYKVAVDREAGLFQQIVSPVLKQRNPEARTRAARTVTELIRLGEVMRGVLLRRELRDHLGGG